MVTKYGYRAIFGKAEEIRFNCSAYQDVATLQDLDARHENLEKNVYVSRSCDYLLEMGLKIFRRRKILVRVITIFSGGASRSCDIARYWSAFFSIFLKGASRSCDRRNILICATIKTYLLCFPRLSSPRRYKYNQERKKTLFFLFQFYRRFEYF